MRKAVPAPAGAVLRKGTQELEAMRAAGRPRQYLNSALPLSTLLEELGKHKAVRYIHVQRGSDSLLIRNRAST